jgi:hypothetical protein
MWQQHGNHMQMSLDHLKEICMKQKFYILFAGLIATFSLSPLFGAQGGQDDQQSIIIIPQNGEEPSRKINVDNAESDSKYNQQLGRFVLPPGRRDSTDSDASTVVREDERAERTAQIPPGPMPQINLSPIINVQSPAITIHNNIPVPQQQEEQRQQAVIIPPRQAPQEPQRSLWNCAKNKMENIKQYTKNHPYRAAMKAAGAATTLYLLGSYCPRQSEATEFVKALQKSSFGTGAVLLNRFFMWYVMRTVYDRTWSCLWPAAYKEYHTETKPVRQSPPNAQQPPSAGQNERIQLVQFMIDYLKHAGGLMTDDQRRAFEAEQKKASRNNKFKSLVCCAPSALSLVTYPLYEPILLFALKWMSKTNHTTDVIGSSLSTTGAALSTAASTCNRGYQWLASGWRSLVPRRV